jgi:DNA-binding LacI/PurR family transcriptional regulator
MTLLDLAEKLNLSISTISRALSRPDLVAPATREKVLAAVQEFGFQPDSIARSLRTRETNTIGIIVPDIANWFFGLIVRAVGQIARDHGYTALVLNADENPEGEAHALATLRARRVSGIINCPVGADLERWRALKRSGVPLVELDRRSGLEQVDAVVLDDENAAMLATEHLIELGHRRIATIAGPQHLSNGRARLRGFQETLREAAIASAPRYIGYGDFREESGYQAMKTFLSEEVPPTAVFIANSEMTGGAIAAIRERKIRVPDQLSVIGFDDARWARYLDPPLTMIAHPTEAMGKCAAELLLKRLTSKQKVYKPKLVLLSPELVVRNSTSAPRRAVPIANRK